MIQSMSFPLYILGEEVFLLKVVFPSCCGIDVHKSFLVATIISATSDLEPSYLRKRFSTFNGDLKRLSSWLRENHCVDVCMESTEKYWVPVFNILESEKINVTIANPKWVAIKGNKDDKKDSKWIGDLFRFDLVPGSFIPATPIRILREFTRYRYKLVSMKSSEKNHFQNAFTVCNIGLDSAVSDLFGKSASLITDYLLSDEPLRTDHCVSLLQRSLKKKADSVIELIEGNQSTEQQKFRMLSIRSHLAYIENSIHELDEAINSMVTPYENAIALMCTIPGLDRKTAITILSEIGDDVSRFNSSKQLCSWARLPPGSN